MMCVRCGILHLAAAGAWQPHWIQTFVPQGSCGLKIDRFSSYAVPSSYIGGVSNGELCASLDRLAHAYLLRFLDDFASGVREHTIEPLARVQVHVA